ncbi:hypothetical protein Rhopal_004542-T1 [Rhodotorula paludigena]|uniref:Meiotically up-regulated protein Msb1/Mug8 domain-containing protein n=1 Tax=Rhodotorula paludigena TaxID=86838 RepID=A0AAV5GQJ2_9BASI|nr:hypothetical protein Rhopal_004542-T1 [Rhodotorula paludigena]
MSLFKRKKGPAHLDVAPAASFQPALAPSSSLAPRRAVSGSSVPSTPTSPYDSHVHIDDFGRPVAGPAFVAQQGAGGAPFGSGHGVGDDEPVGEMQLLYGYAPIATTLELSIIKVEKIVAACAVELQRRGLDTPLILSSMALDISLEGVTSLIRVYLDDPSAWISDLALAHPLSVGAFMKWGLARLINERGRRGFVSWDSYNEFKTAERGFPPKSCTVHLISRLSASNGRLLTSLLTLFSTIAAHSATNGMPPRKLAALFSPYVFGLADDRGFDETYEEWQRATDAFEHILLSFVRDQQAQGQLPTFLERFVAGYPEVLNISYSGAPPRVPKGSRVEEVTRVRRSTRFHSRNLIQQGGTWDVPYSNDWRLFFTSTLSSSPSPDSTDRPAFTASYRHLLNIRSGHGLEDDDDEGELQRFKSVVEKDWAQFGQLGFQDVDEKKLEFDLSEGEREAVRRKRDTMDWSTFETAGFTHEVFAPTHLVFHHTLNQRVNTWPSSQQQLTQRLKEAEKALPPFPYDTTPREHARVTVDADFFETWADVLVGGGWARDELKESSFALIQWKARPREGDPIRGKSSTGDARTEERWVLVEEVVPREYREALLADPKTKKQSKRVSFMRAVRRKSSFNSSAAPSASQPARAGIASSSTFTNLVSAPITSSYARKESNLRPIDEAVFDPNNDSETKLVSLSKLHLGPSDYATYAPSASAPSASRYAPSTAYAPSVISTVRAADGHDPSSSTANLSAAERDFVPPPMPPHQGIAGTISSQRREPLPASSVPPAAAPVFSPEPPFPTASSPPSLAPPGPVGYTKPSAPEKKGFLARMGTRRGSGNKLGLGSLGGSGSGSGGSGASTQSTMSRLWRGPNGAKSVGAGATAPPANSTGVLAPAVATVPEMQRNGSSGSGRGDAYAYAAPALVQTPSWTTGTLPGVPPLAPVAEHPPAASTTAIPPRTNGSAAHLEPASQYNGTPDNYSVVATASSSSPFDNGYRASVQSTITSGGDPYGGMDDSDASTDLHADVQGAEVGRVLFRGSQSFPDGLDEAAAGTPRRPSVASTVQPGSPPRRREDVSLEQPRSPPRKESLPQSAPYDPAQGDHGSAPAAHADGAAAGGCPSGVSQFSTRVANIVGMYEQRDPHPHGEDVRLTEYGFGPNSGGGDGR